MTKMTPSDLAWQKRILDCQDLNCPWRNSAVCYRCMAPKRQPMRPKEEVVASIVFAASEALRQSPPMRTNPLLSDTWRDVVSKELDPLYEKAEYTNTELRLLHERCDRLGKELAVEIEGREDIARRNYLLIGRLKQAPRTLLLVFEAFILSLLCVLIGAAFYSLFGG